MCLNLPTREFYWAVGAGLFLWYGSRVFTWVCDASVRPLASRPHHWWQLGLRITKFRNFCGQSHFPKEFETSIAGGENGVVALERQICLHGGPFARTLTCGNS